MKELKFSLANGFAILLTRYENDEIFIELVNTDNFIVSHKKLNESYVAYIQELLSK